MDICNCIRPALCNHRHTIVTYFIVAIDLEDNMTWPKEGEAFDEMRHPDGSIILPPGFNHDTDRIVGAMYDGHENVVIVERTLWA